MSIRETAGSWRIAVRVARRAAVRSKARTLLIVLMLALPVYAGTVLALSYSATYASADAEVSWWMGRADYSVQGERAGEVLAALPAGSRTETVTYGKTVLRTGDTYQLRDYAAAEVDAPLTQGIFSLRDGRAPRGGAELAVSRRMAERDGIRIGDRVAVGLPPRERTVVGIVDAARELSIPLVVTAADQRLNGSLPHTLVALPPGAAWTPPDPRDYMVCEDTSDGGRTCNSGASVRSRQDGRPSAAELATRTAAFVLVVGFAGTQVALLAGAAFAIGARRQRRELAMVGAVGAGRRQIARMVLAHGLVLGAVAGVAGMALGALTYWLNRDRVEWLANHPLNPSSVPVGWLVAIAAFAVAVGLLAALGPARGAARETLRAALAGREPSTRAANLRWLVGGLLVAAGGAAAAVLAAGPTGSVVTVAAGTVAVLLGVTALAPVLVGLVSRGAARLPLAVRLAARHAGRHRLRTAASAAAVCTAVAGSMALMLYAAADSVEPGAVTQPNARAGQVLIPTAAAERLAPEALGAVAAALPARASLPLRTVAGVARMNVPEGAAPLFPSDQVAVGGVDLIRAVTGAEPPPAALAALRDGGAVVFHPELLLDGALQIGDGVRLPAVLVPAPDYYTDLPGAVTSAATAARHRLTTNAGGVVIDTTRAPTAAETAAANSRVLAGQLAADGSALPVEIVVGARPAERGRDYGAMFLVLAAVSAAVTLAASAVAVGLATSEMRGDLATLTAVGAGPRLRRRIAGAQAGLIVGVGVLLGVVGGIAPAAGMVAFAGDLEWRIPWLPMAITVLVAPVLAVAGTALLTRPRLILIRRLS
ncbi:FtsX-like permease family protein [Actinomycetes bacterium KLBMP 9797]